MRIGKTLHPFGGSADLTAERFHPISKTEGLHPDIWDKPQNYFLARFSPKIFL